MVGGYFLILSHCTFKALQLPSVSMNSHSFVSWLYLDSKSVKQNMTNSSNGQYAPTKETMCLSSEEVKKQNKKAFNRLAQFVCIFISSEGWKSNDFTSPKRPASTKEVTNLSNFGLTDQHFIVPKILLQCMFFPAPENLCISCYHFQLKFHDDDPERQLALPYARLNELAKWKLM